MWSENYKTSHHIIVWIHKNPKKVSNDFEQLIVHISHSTHLTSRPKYFYQSIHTIWRLLALWNPSPPSRACTLPTQHSRSPPASNPSSPLPCPPPSIQAASQRPAAPLVLHPRRASALPAPRPYFDLSYKNLYFQGTSKLEWMKLNIFF
jgi:hypothetical protein